MGSIRLKDRAEEIESLVLKVQEGDQEAFSQLYDILIDPIYKYVFFRVKREDAEDVVENIFLKVWQNIKKYQSRNKLFTAWVFRIAHNLVVDYYRAAKKYNFDELNESLADDNRRHNPIKNTQQVLDKELLKQALNKLKKVYRDVLVYKFINGLTNKEIAVIMKKTEGNLRILQFRALRSLKTILQDMGVEYSPMPE